FSCAVQRRSVGKWWSHRFARFSDHGTGTPKKWEARLPLERAPIPISCAPAQGQRNRNAGRVVGTVGRDSRGRTLIFDISLSNLRGSSGRLNSIYKASSAKIAANDIRPLSQFLEEKTEALRFN